jgi:hypothetical protein
MSRPTGPGLYQTIHLPRATRIDDTRATHRDSNPLPAQPDPQRTADELATRSRRLLPGHPTMESLRRYIDGEAEKARIRLAQFEVRR